MPKYFFNSILKCFLFQKIWRSDCLTNYSFINIRKEYIQGIRKKKSLALSIMKVFTFGMIDDGVENVLIKNSSGIDLNDTWTFVFKLLNSTGIFKRIKVV